MTRSSDVLLVATLAATGVLTILVVLLAREVVRLRRAYRVALRPGEDAIGALARHQQELDALRGDLATVHRNTERLRELLRSTISRTAVVRYDAFPDMGGALSFSAAFLDEHGNGLVLSAINGRTETRAYAKPVVGGTSEFNLSPEEIEAIETAQRGGSGPDRRGARR